MSHRATSSHEVSNICYFCDTLEQMYHPEKPYNDLPLLPPKVNILTRAMFNKVVSANRALAELKGLGETIPNQSIIINSLILKEAKDSSEIENIITTQDDLYKAFSAEKSILDPAVKEVLNYREALWYGFKLINKRKIITTNDLIKIQAMLISNNAGIRVQPGTALKNTRTNETIYTPPFGKDVIETKLKNLEEYMNLDDDETDPLIKMAIIHYQFESIHPFYDGNGRTGRILNVLYLIQKKLLNLPILYLSSYIISQKAKYYEGLNNVRNDDAWEDWILFMLESVEVTAVETIKLVKMIKGLLAETTQNVKSNLPRIYSKELIEVLFQQPYCKAKHLVDSGIVARQRASVYLKQLEKAGILRLEKVGRENLYVNIRLFELLKD